MYLSSSAVDDPSAAALARHVSISRSGRYKSKSKQRASLLANSLDFTTAVVIFSDDVLTSPEVVNPTAASSADTRQRPVRQKEVSPAHTDVKTSKAVASTVTETAATTSVSASTEVDGEKSPKSVDKSCLPAALDSADVCADSIVAEMDESTDL